MIDKRVESLIQETVKTLENLKKVHLDLLERKDINSEEQFASEYFKVVDPIMSETFEMVARRKRIVLKLISEGAMPEETPQEIEKLEREIQEINPKIAERFGGDEKYLQIIMAHYEKIASKIEKEMEL